MTASSLRKSQLRAQRHQLKNAVHTCGDCGRSVGQHPLGRSAHDRMAIHVAVEHHKYLDRECIGGKCRATPFVPRERRGMAV